MCPDAQAFIEAMRPAVRQAAAIARALEGRVRNRPKSGEANDVKAALTLADTAAQEALLVPLHLHLPDVSLQAEEDTPSVMRFPRGRPTLVVIDPIDGTLRSYLDGLGPYAVMLGLAFRGRYEAGLVALPREGWLFEAVRGRGARVLPLDEEDAPSRAEDAARRVMVSFEMPDAVQQRLREQGYEVVFGCGGAIAVAPLVPGVCGGLRIASSPAGVSIRGRIGVLVAEEGGMRTASEHGTPFPDVLDAPAEALLVARDENVLQDLRAALLAAR